MGTEFQLGKMKDLKTDSSESCKDNVLDGAVLLLSCSVVSTFASPGTEAHQVPLCLEFPS